MQFHWIELKRVRIYGHPKGQPRSRSRKGQKGVFDPGTADGWKAIIRQAFEPHMPELTLDEPLRVDVDFYFRRPKNFNARTKRAYGGAKNIPDGPVLFTAKPDRDNADKALLDGLSDLSFFRDDALVCDGRIRKFYAAKTGRPGAMVRVMVWRHVE